MKLKKNESDLKYFNKQKENLSLQLDNLLLEKIKYKESIEILNDNILDLQTNKNQNNLSFYLHSFVKKLKQNEKILNELEEQILDFKKQLQEEVIILKKLSFLESDDPFLQESYFKINNFFQKKTLEKNFLALKDDIQKISYYLSKKIIDFNIEKDNLKKEIIILKNKIDNNNHEIKMINYTSFSQNNNFNKIIILLKEELKKIYNENIFVYPLCELIEIKDEIWRNAIEGFLGYRKFNLIIDPKYFNIALKIYGKLQDDLKIYDIGLINISKIPEITINYDSLAFYIKSDNLNALKYVRILLSNVKCETNIENLTKHKIAITPQVMLYSNYTAKKINPKIYKIPYIGINSSKIRKDIIEKELDIQKKNLIQKKEHLKKNEKLIEIISKNKMYSFINFNYLKLLKDKIEIENKNINLQKEIDKLKNNNEIIIIEENIIKLKEDKKNKNNKLDEILLQIAETKNTKNICEIKIKNLEQEIFLEKKKLSEEKEKIEYIQKQSNIYIETKPNNYEKIFQTLKEENKKIEKQKNNFQIDLISLMKIYINNYDLFNIEPKLENFYFFLQEYNLINSKNLIEYKKEIKELSLKTEIIFKEEFINKLRESIIEAQQQIKKLNQVLKNKPFGNDYYQIVIKPSEEPEYKKYYSFLTDFNNLDKINSYIEKNNDAYKNIFLDELFQKIIYFEKEYENIYHSFLDYRNYLSYDIKIYDQEGNFSFFPKILEKNQVEKPKFLFILL
ncbi:MAG: hypothetical protein Q8885_01210 [Candidatus Phytoplasma stylosanthis]|nr:hypothetical protein [Candidatus Phytoplasma stylosanthis]